MAKVPDSDFFISR